jgi:selenide,water dikinase
VQSDDGSQFAFDVLSVDTGSVPPRSAIVGADASGVSVKPVERFLDAWQAVLGERPARTRSIAVVGAGAGGVEIALAMRAQLRKMQRGIDVVLCGESPELLPSHSPAARRRVRAAITSRGIQCRLGRRVTRAAEGTLHFADGTSIDADWIVWATGAAAPRGAPPGGHLA